MTAYLPLAATIVAVALMYVVCIRPMRRKDGSCHTPVSRAPGLDEQIRQLREELTLLRHEADLRNPASRDSRIKP